MKNFDYIIEKGTIIKGVKSINQPDLIVKKDIKLNIKPKIVYEIISEEFNIYSEVDKIEDIKYAILSELNCNYNIYNEVEENEEGYDIKIKLDKVLKPIK